MARSTFKYAIGSTVYAVKTANKDDNNAQVTITECKIDSVHVDNTSTVYHVSSTTACEATYSENKLFPDKESVYKEVDRIFNI